ncbi:MAG: hypothetical protein K2O88_08040, partial [Paramuribaculum sp.]|nr:hypothetical protein [Paramuribaculum sp.]
MSEKVNVDFIVTAMLNEAGLLEFQRKPIAKLFDEEMQSLQAMCDNDNRNVMDLQDAFQRFMPKGNTPEYFDYCAPHGYSSSFIGCAAYPKIYTFDEYKAELKREENRTINSFLEGCDVDSIDFLSSKQESELTEAIAQGKTRCEKFMKLNFFKVAERYVQAYRYSVELSHIKADERNKMFSTENIGWTSFNYPISDDILFFMKSNFGYGRSSYHFINMTYKGIDILPYSALVKYYYVSMAEFYRYTRQYRPTHENWEVALDFVVETANLALQDETAFISKWIGNEIDEMIAGLKIISENPDAKLKEFFTKPRKDTNFLYVRNAYKADEEEYVAYPTEISTIFKAEKLSAALDLLDKLKVLAPAYPKALEAIEEIKSLNIDFLPNLKEHIQAIETEIEHRQAILNPKIEERDQLKSKGQFHYERLNTLIEEARKNGNYNPNPVRKQYFSQNQDFKKLYNEVNERSEEISKEEQQITLRKAFI